MPVEPTAGEPSSFEDAARAADLVQPTPKRLNVALAVIAIVIIIGASLGLGYSFGWFTPSAPRPGYTHPAACATPVALLTGTVDAYATPLLNATFANWTGYYTASSGGCIAFTLNGTTGSGAVSDLSALHSDFLLTSAPLSPAQQAGLPHAVYQIPLLLESVAVIYNPTGLPDGLALSGDALAGIFLGSVPAWDTPLVAGTNPGDNLSGAPPLSVDRPSAAGDVPGAFSQYLASANATWAAEVGAGPSVAWPTGTALGSEAAVVAAVAATPGAIGFVETAALGAADVDTVAVENAAGQFVGPGAAGATAAGAAIGAENATFEQHWANVSLPDAPGNASYPLAAVGFAVVYTDLGTAFAGALSNYDAWWLLTFFEWIVNANATAYPTVGPAPLPADLVTLDGQVLAEVNYHGISVLVGGNDGSETGSETGEF